MQTGWMPTHIPHDFRRTEGLKKLAQEELLKGSRVGT
jgi:hypothetical protein